MVMLRPFIFVAFALALAPKLSQAQTRGHYPLVSAGVTAVPVPVPDMSRRNVDVVIEYQTNSTARALCNGGT
jgi:hypothetical protein